MMSVEQKLALQIIISLWFHIISLCCGRTRRLDIMYFMSGTHIEFEQARITLFLLESQMNCSSFWKCNVTYMSLCTVYILRY